MRNFQNAALLLGERPSRGGPEPQRPRRREHAQVPVHRHLPPVQWRGPTGPTVASRRPVYRALTPKQHQTIGYHLWVRPHSVLRRTMLVGTAGVLGGVALRTTPVRSQTGAAPA